MAIDGKWQMWPWGNWLVPGDVLTAESIAGFKRLSDAEMRALGAVPLAKLLDNYKDCVEALRRMIGADIVGPTRPSGVDGYAQCVFCEALADEDGVIVCDTDCSWQNMRAALSAHDALFGRSA